jgi:hypothetical protein
MLGSTPATALREIRLMLDTAIIDAENPFGALALEPIRRRLDHTCGQKIVSLPVFVGILIESGQEHPGP